MGQGIATSYAQLAVDVFGVPIEKIRIVQGDTDRGNGFGSAGSRSLFTGGSAVQRRLGAHDRAREDARRRGARGRRRRHRVPRRALRGRRHRSRHRPVRARRQAARAAHPSSTRRATAGGPTWPNALPRLRGRDRSARPATSRSSPTRRSTTSAASSARRSSRGQVDGGAVQGIGQALCEQIVYDAEQRPARHRQLHGLRGAARRRRRRLPHRVRHLDPVPDSTRSASRASASSARSARRRRR